MGDPVGKVLAECLNENPKESLYAEVFLNISDGSVSLVDVNTIIIKGLLNRIEKNTPDNWQSVADFSGLYAKALFNKGEYESALIYARKSTCLSLHNHSLFSVEGVDQLSILADIYVSLEQLEPAILIQEEMLNSYKVSEPFDASSIDYIRCFKDLPNYP